MGGQIGDTTKNIRKDLKGTEDDRKKDKLKKEEHWKQFRKSKKKIKQKELEIKEWAYHKRSLTDL